MIRPIILRTVTQRYKVLHAEIINAKARLWAGSASLTMRLYRFSSQIPVRLSVWDTRRFGIVYSTALPIANWPISGCRQTVPGSDGIGTLPRTYRESAGSERPESAYPAGSRVSKTNRQACKHAGGRLILDTDTHRIADKTRSASRQKGRRVSGSGVLP
jgi:hypothetical protein